ncbi:MAG: S41 family peptidase [Bacteriovoracales bacterium]|nr:S41 family peptidase [Bacteriovoracales bacterium]
MKQLLFTPILFLSLSFSPVFSWAAMGPTLQTHAKTSETSSGYSKEDFNLLAHTALTLLLTVDAIHLFNDPFLPPNIEQGLKRQDNFITHTLDTFDEKRLIFTAEDIELFQMDPYSQSLFAQNPERLTSETALYTMKIQERYLQRIEETITWLDSQSDQTLDLEEASSGDFKTHRKKWDLLPQDQKTRAWALKLKENVITRMLKEEDLSQEKAQEEGLETIRGYLLSLKKATSLETSLSKVLNSLLKTVDPYTKVFSPKLRNLNMASAGQSYEGIGIVIGIDPDTQETTLMGITPDSPADKAGLKEGDVILGVGKVDDKIISSKMELDELLNRIKAIKGTLCLLYRQAEESDDSFHQACMKKEPINSARSSSPLKMEKTQEMLGEKSVLVGEIKINQFYAGPNISLAQDVKDLLEKNRDIQALVINLSGNGGGDFMAVSRLIELFIEEGDILVSVSPKRKQRVARMNLTRDPFSPKEGFYKIPLLVAIDEESASASEIFAAAIQDHARGIVVGTKSFGKGTAQNVTSPGKLTGGPYPVTTKDWLTEDWLVVATESFFVRASGDLLESHGVVPDVHFKSFKSTGDEEPPFDRNWLPLDKKFMDSISPRHIRPIDKALLKEMQSEADRFFETDEYYLNFSRLNREYSKWMEEKDDSINYETLKNRKKEYEALNKRLDETLEKTADGALVSPWKRLLSRLAALHAVK